MTLPDIPLAMSIDDEAIDQRLVRRILERSGKVGEVLTYQLAEDALAYLRQDDARQVDVIFLDINMPRMNGFEFLDAATAEFGESFAKCVVIMLTTSLDPKDKERAQSHDIVKDFIGKPLTLEQIGHVADILRAHHASEEQ